MPASAARASSSDCAFARQPAMEKRLLPVTWLAFALAEAMGLFALLIAFIFIFT